ncbi:MAG: phosphatidylserine decarboxylase [Thermoplasmata archaeon]|jgi:phosphatidylserine decarboxylase|nr:phosphatidylserine decarboxylase [Thermoplasmata archaeon]
MRTARGSLGWLLLPPLLALLLWALGRRLDAEWLQWGALVPVALFGFFLAFFRDPERAVAAGVASPADGKVVRLDQVQDRDLGACDRLSIFMHPKDVHVNRFPLAGTVVSVTHVAGGHIPAFNKDSHLNERVETLLDTAELGRIKVIQIAGTVARRIVPYIAAGDVAAKGARMGLIRFGSRCDLLVPPGSVVWSAKLGDQVHAGSTPIGTVVAPAGVRR